MVSTADTGTVHAFARDGYRISIEPSGERARVVFNGEAVADSSDVLLMHETRLPSIY